jgi:Cof subfamily protein (haloacid dehalogenase superfamily)
VTSTEIRLVALDLDGTLLTSAGELPSEGAALLAQAAAQGIHIILATTRHYHSTLRFYRELNLSSPLICGNGAQVWASAEGPLWAEYCINEEAARAIAQLADEQQWELAITVGEMIYWRQRPGQPLGLQRPNITVVATNRDMITAPPLRILTWQVEAIEAIGAFCRSTLTEHCSVEVYVKSVGEAQSLGIFAPLANKGAALTLVMDRLGVRREQVVTMGDNFNDLPMFACGEISVAMANAPDAVRQQASLLAPSNDDEGIAWALKEFQIV